MSNKDREYCNSILDNALNDLFVLSLKNKVPAENYHKTTTDERLDREINKMKALVQKHRELLARK